MRPVLTIESRPVRPYYLIHQPGKVASQTIEYLIRVLSADARVERHHYLSDRRNDDLESLLRLPGADAENARSFAYQLARARTVRAELAEPATRPAWVITGFRDPLVLAISGFFQNLQTFCPWVDYATTDPNREVDRLIEHFELGFEELRSGRSAETFQSALLALKLEGPEPWFDSEFNEVHGIDIYRHEIGEAPFMIFEREGVKFCVYRMETLPSAVPSLMRALGFPPAIAAHNWNVGDDKPYAGLYRVFKERFQPTVPMIEYYYGGKFFRHFYRPLWAGVDDALQRIRRSAVSPMTSAPRCA